MNKILLLTKKYPILSLTIGIILLKFSTHYIASLSLVILEIIITTIIAIWIIYIGLGYTNRLKKLLITLGGGYMLLAFVIFPFCYMRLINADPTCVEINEDVMSYQKNNRLAYITEKFPLKQKQELIILDTILKSKAQFLQFDTKYPSPNLEVQEEIDTYKVYNFIIVSKILPREGFTIFTTMPFKPGIIVYSNNMKEYFRIVDMRGILQIEDNSIGNMLNHRYLYLQSKYLESTREKKLTHLNKNWTLWSITPYVLYDSGLITFKKPTIIIIHALHIYICNGILLAIIVGVIYDLLKNNNST